MCKVVGTTRIMPYVHGLTLRNLALSPLQQFRGQQADQAGTWELVSALNAVMPTPISLKVLSASFEDLWPSLERQLGALDFQAEDQPQAVPTSESKLDEILSLLRQQDQLLQKAVSNEFPHSVRPRKATPQAPPATLAAEFTRSVGMQLRAFIKPAALTIDAEQKTLTLTYSDKNAFHGKHVLTKLDEGQNTLSKLTNDEYTLIVVDSNGQQHRSQSETS